MKKNRKILRALKRYHNDLRAIQKANHSDWKTAQVYYRMVRDQAGLKRSDISRKELIEVSQMVGLYPPPETKREEKTGTHPGEEHINVTVAAAFDGPMSEALKRKWEVRIESPWFSVRFEPHSEDESIDVRRQHRQDGNDWWAELPNVSPPWYVREPWDEWWNEGEKYIRLKWQGPGK